MSDITDLLAIMVRLRDPEHGCPWDREQDSASIAHYTIEEAYEVVDAIDRGDSADLCSELGDLLLHVVFHARIAEEAGQFKFDDVVAAICGKMIARHPHVFGDARIDSAHAQTEAWESHKQRERTASGDHDPSALAGISRGMPEWQRAIKLQKRAARVGFEWPALAPVLDKLDEEITEVRAEVANGADAERMTEEIGDVLFAAVNLARMAKVDVSGALRQANRKFERRFRAMETTAEATGRTLAEHDMAGQLGLWQQVKVAESAADSGND